MNQGPVMIPSPSLHSSIHVLRGSYNDGAVTAEMMPTPGVDANAPPWGNNDYSTAPGVTVPFSPPMHCTNISLLFGCACHVGFSCRVLHSPVYRRSPMALAPQAALFQIYLVS
jgi:hypothetical protein